MNLLYIRFYGIFLVLINVLLYCSTDSLLALRDTVLYMLGICLYYMYLFYLYNLITLVAAKLLCMPRRIARSR